MKIKGLKGKQVLLISVISLLSAGIILSSNWSYFIKNNENNNISLTSYKIKINNINTYTEHSNMEYNIMFQINILKSAIKKNKIMYQEYNSVFKHNINYIRLDKNSIINKIQVANSSITHELDILNNMKMIINNHPYNYLKFFQSKNYTPPQIISRRILDIPSSFDDIKTQKSDIDKLNTTFTNISYDLEETVVGVGAVSSIISSTKELIFSKNSFDYNSIYYFSNYSNNLSTFNESINKKTYMINNNSTTINQDRNNNNFSQKETNDKKKIYNKNFLSLLVDSYYSIKDHLSLTIGVSGGLIFGSVVGTIYLTFLRSNWLKSKILKLTTKTKTESHIVATSEVSNSGPLLNRTEGHNTTHLDSNSEPQTDKSVSNELDSDKILSNSIRNSETEQYISNMYADSIPMTPITYENFRSQIINYAVIKSRNDSITSHGINSKVTKHTNRLANRNINEINRDWSTYQRTINHHLYVSNAEEIKTITAIRAETPSSVSTKTTKFGWFDIPDFEEIGSASISITQKKMIATELRSFEAFLMSVPNYQNSTLMNDDYSIISSQIFSDLTELIWVYQAHLLALAEANIVHNTDEEGAETTKLTLHDIQNYFKYFKNSRLRKTNFDDLSHIGIKGLDITSKLDEISKL